jgi:two-component system, cell cycle sensor histidine kinase and response regulator CckA
LFPTNSHLSQLLTLRLEVAVLLLALAVTVWGLALRIQVRRRTTDLGESESRYRSLVDSLPDGVAVHAGGQIVFVNAAFVKLLGASNRDELLKRPVLDFVHPDDRASAASRMAAILHGGPPTFATETRLLKSDGTYITVETAGTQTIYSGKPAVLVRAHDITVRLGMEAQLRHGQKMEALGRLAGGVAHDFNNLLTAITMNAELVLEGMAVGSPHRDEIEEIQSATSRAAALTKQLLVFSRKQPLSFGVIDLTKLVAGSQKLLRRLTPEHITFDLDLAEDIPSIKGDSGQLEQIVMNLVVNARDAMPDGGTLRIVTSNAFVTAESHPAVSQMPPGCYARLSVSDTGIGMDASTIARVFEPFFTTKGIGHGTGLGLSLVHGLVSQFDGYLSVESLVGRGTTFDIYFPTLVHPPGMPAPVPLEPDDAESVTTAGSGTVLLVEDDPSIRSSIARMLMHEGFSVREATSGVEALQVLAERDGELKLLLSDLIMPDLGGREVAESLKRTHPRTAILFMSGYEEEAFTNLATLPAGSGFIQKPFTRADLVSRIRNLLGADWSSESESSIRSG